MPALTGTPAEPRPPQPRPARLRPATLARVARQIAADLDQWRHLLRPGPKQGWGHRLLVVHDHEVWLRGWLRGQWTGLHDHGGSFGAFAIAHGELREHTFDPAGRDAVVRVRPPAVSACSHRDTSTI